MSSLALVAGSRRLAQARGYARARRDVARRDAAAGRRDCPSICRLPVRGSGRVFGKWQVGLDPLDLFGLGLWHFCKREWRLVSLRS